MSEIEDYILRHTEPEPDYLYRLWRATNIHTIHGRMASGHLQGRLLKMLVRMIRPATILEVGTFSGYSAISMAEGLDEGGRLYTGDLGSLDTRGALCLTGRKKDMLVLPDGTKIFCPEYEEELSGLIGLSDLTVILKQDRPFLVIGDSGGNVPENIDSLLAEFNEKRAMGLRICGVLSYGKPLPRTATGKIRRWEIEK